MSILIVGRGFIARAVAAALPDARLLPHDTEPTPALLDGVRAVLWGGRHPSLGTPEWRLDGDGEPRLAAALGERDVAFVSLGTRKVYAPATQPLAEAAPLGPIDRYGEQKLALEHRLRTILGQRLTTLRIANVIGFEPGRRSFMGAMLGGLAREGIVRFDMSPFTRRDFVPVQVVGWLIATLLDAPPGGVLNLGAGFSIECGRLALTLIESYGAGALLIDDPRERDAFELDIARLSALTGRVSNREELLATVRDCGHRLREGQGD
ncbi:MAG: NAD(P)-dependent oxidoreductase [Geminicoccaceae bacterium]